MHKQPIQKYGRVSIKSAINGFLAEASDKSDTTKKAIRIYYVMSLYRQAIESIYKDSAFLVLDKTNAVYIFSEKDKGFRRKARPGDKIISKMVIYTCDSTVHADLDSRQEHLKMWMENHGERIDKLDLLTSKLGMRKKFPFASVANQLKNNVENTFIRESDLYCNIDDSQYDICLKENSSNFRLSKSRFFDDNELKKLNYALDEVNDENLRNSLKKLIFKI